MASGPSTWVSALIGVVWVASACAAQEPCPPEQASTSTAALEQQIRAADQAERRAFLDEDSALQGKIWADDFFVINPFGEVYTRTEVMGALASGQRPYRSLERETEDVRMLGEVAVSRGMERVVPAGTDDVVHRRFTHVWVWREDRWQLLARHAVIVEPAPAR